MFKLKYKVFYFILFVFLLFVFPKALLLGQEVSGKSKRVPRVLLLHSYHKGYKWTDDISKGVEDGLSSDVTLYTDYLDTKRNPFDEDYFNLLYKIFEFKVNTQKFDLIICSDNNALDFVKRCQDSLLNMPPVIFCGINELSKEEVVGLNGYTGVNEKADIGKGLNLISQLHPQKKNLFVITDVTVTGQRVRSQVENIITENPNLFSTVEIVDNISMKNLLTRVSQLDKEWIIYYAFFFRDSLGIFYEYDKSARMICNTSNVPVYSAWDFNLGYGVVGGYLVSGYQQGFKAAELAKKVLSGVAIKDIPVIMESPNQFSFDYLILKKYNIDISGLEHVDKVINEPTTFFEEYPELVVSIIILVVFLLVIILLLFINSLIKKKAAKKIRQGKEHLETTLNSIGDGVISTDNNGIITNMNPIAEKLTEWTEKDAVSKPLNKVFRIVNTKTGQPTDNIISRIHELGNIIHLTSKSKLISKTGKEYHVSNSAAPIIDQSGRISGVVIVFRDVTEEHLMTKALKTSEKKFRKYIQASSIAVCLVNEKNLISFANPSTENLTGYSAKELINLNLFSLVSKDTLGQTLAKYRDVGKKEKLKDIEVKIMRKDGSEVFALLDGVWLNKTSYIFYCRNIDDLKKTQSDLAKKNEEYKALTEELKLRITDLKELNTKLEESKERAEESDRLKSAFLANMSHEIRTPLNGIMGFSGLLDDPALPYEKQKKFVQVIQKSGERILNIFNHIIDISKIEAGQTKINYSDVNINEILNYHYDFFIPLVKSKGLKLNLVIPQEAPLLIKTDSTKFEQVLTNLLKNAIKFTEKGYIEYGYNFKRKFVEFYVKDTGIGIAPEMHEVVFKRFMQVGAIDGSFYDGAGIGLSISKAYVNLLGGEMRLESESGAGAVFYFTLPKLSSKFKVSNSSV